MKLNVENLKKIYGDKTVLKDISVKIDDQQIIAFLGASGSGKSTLLRLIAGLEPFQGGKLCVNDHTVETDDAKAEAYRKRIGFVFQDHNLFNHLTVMDNLLLVLEKVHHRKHEDVLPELHQLLRDFDLFDHKDKYPHQLSGGQSQRVSIVRALSIKPELILLDEPTSSLDPILTYEVLSSVKKLAEEKKDFVIVTHEIGFAKQVADYIIFMDDGEIIEHGPKSILDKPSSEKLQNFLNKVLPFNQND
ncbi:amino acid ABC transporter ATP-binding protein [Acidaminobacter sp. JC074]|uniref:amino acid ABC transporter ATP-binding protein n=1 Tax=Acidaminobacter sp. JC074 TaxID=2530199 RepID=UPI001F0F81EC|nr:amino acid ABC transporter ATP-binding protein [Acidaminobacter sp. JC074]MCH4887995.1 amino acid ABC transporter ATP-binding protein [Acidaminobacter sp. JC074]